jgi:hypothetical protein
MLLLQNSPLEYWKFGILGAVPFLLLLGGQERRKLNSATLALPTVSLF